MYLASAAGHTAADFPPDWAMVPVLCCSVAVSLVWRSAGHRQMPSWCLRPREQCSDHDTAVVSRSNIEHVVSGERNADDPKAVCRKR